MDSGGRSNPGRGGEHSAARSRVYEVMHRKRALSLEMIRRLNERFAIPAEVLIRSVRPSRRRRAA
ncbi:MAG TPA: hypothetical protein VMB26_11925 [Candidatus Binataceae bacterium]|nr:hypothetical protein [Candidatus Binataceae bacterium]